MIPGEETQKLDWPMLCDMCSKINFQMLLEGPSTKFCRIFFTPGCVLCELLQPDSIPKCDLFGRQFSTEHLLSSTSYFDQCHAWRYDKLVDAQSKVAGARDSIVLKLGPGFTPKHWVFCCPREKSGPSLFQPRVVQSTCNYATVKSWLNNCDELHDCISRESSSLVNGMKLIDCNNLDIIAADSSSRWIALSYVWGSPVQPDDIDSSIRESRSIGSHLPDFIPHTVRDAITVTRELGYRFLWVDEFCIEQGDRTHRADQIKQMDRIYQGADLTIVAAVGKDKYHGLPGVGTTQRSKSNAVEFNDFTIISLGPDPVQLINESKWQSRGWTLQEGLLSKRLLVFTENQMSYYCQKASWQEGLHGPECIKEPHNIDWNDWPIHIDLFQGERNLYKNHDHNPLLLYRNHDDDHLALYKEYFSIIMAYKHRTLSNEADQFDAFAGILKHMGKRSPARHNIWGLPFIPDAFQDRVEIHLLLGLSWCHLDMSSERRRQYPSWTWAEWTGGVSWAASSDSYDCQPCYATFRLISLHMPDSASILSSNVIQQAPELLIKFDDFPTNTGQITIEVPILPASCLVRDQVASSPRYYIHIGGYLPKVKLNLRPSILEQLPNRVRDKTWELCLLGWTHWRKTCRCLFFLVIEGLDESRAERVDSLFVMWFPKEGENFESILAGWEHRKITLV